MTSTGAVGNNRLNRMETASVTDNDSVEQRPERIQVRRRTSDLNGREDESQRSLNHRSWKALLCWKHRHRPREFISDNLDTP